MLKSVAFYPEYLERSTWKENMQKVKDGGIDLIRFGEFAWGLIEPEEDIYNWEVFDEAFAMAEEVGLKVILGTPTACPPVWLADKYPEILPINARGETIGFGGRQHRCYNSEPYKTRTKIMVNELSKRYGKNKTLFAWQIDNELGAEQKYCYCDGCKEKFQSCLNQKYNTIEELNRRWMTNFWSQNYKDFSQIPLPKELNAYWKMRQHPSLQYDFYKFSSDSIVQFCDMQAEVIRQNSDRPITTNQDDFEISDNVNWYDIFKNLDVVGFDTYTDKLHVLGFYFDLCRAVKEKPFWLVEYNSRSPILKSALDLANEKGCDVAGLFVFNPFPAGQEQGMYGLLDLFGNPRPHYYIFRDWKQEENAASPKKINMFYDFNSSFAYFIKHQDPWKNVEERRRFELLYPNYLTHRVYRGVFEAGYSVDFISDWGAINNPVTILPLQLIYSKEISQGLLQYIKNGGTLITTNDLFLKNEDNVFFTEMPDFYTEVMGDAAAYIEPDNSKLILRDLCYGKGRVLFVDNEMDLSGWKEVIAVIG